MPGMKILLRCIFSLVDVATGIYIFTALGLPKYLLQYVMEPVVAVQNTLSNHCYANVICPLWLCVHLGLRLYRLREGPKKLSKKRTQQRLVDDNMSAKLCGLKTPLENVETVKAFTFAELRHRVVVKKDLAVLDMLEGLQVHLLRLIQSSACSVAEVIFDADVAAIMADQALKNGGTLTPIHGVPVCLSNCFSVKGEDCNASAVFRACGTQSHDSVLVSALRDAGAILVALTNASPIPGQADASSRLYGTAQHHTHPDRVVGHSANAVVIAEKGAFLGFGLDMLGEVRISAANVGIVGFKPTGHRLSTEGIITPVAYPRGLDPTVGIVAVNVSDVVGALESLTAHQKSVSIPRLPFKLEASKEKLKIGVFKSLPGMVSVVPAVSRILDKAVAVLKAQGHTIVEVEIPKPDECLMLALYSLMESQDIYKTFVQEHYGNSLTWTEMFGTWLTTAPRFLRSSLSFFLRTQQGASCAIMKKILKAWKYPIALEEITERKEAYRRDFFEMWDDEEIDALIGPSAPSPALLKSASTSLGLMQSAYATILNTVNCPAGSVPFGNVTKEDVEEAVNEQAPVRSLQSQILKQQKGTEGLSVSVQVAAKPWADDVALRLMKQLEQNRSD